MGNVTASGDPNVHTIGNKWQSFTTIALSSSYAASGDTLAARTVGLGVVDSLDLVAQGSGLHFKYNNSLGTIQAFQTGLTVTATATAGLTALYSTGGTSLSMRTTSGSDMTLGTGLTEVTAGTDLSSIGIEARAIGS